MNIRKAIIPAAGLGTRFLPATKAMPKEMLPIIDKPTIQFIVEEAAASGIEDIIIVTGKGKRSIEDHFDGAYELECRLEQRNKHDLLEEVRKPSRMADIHYIRQKEPQGLGHAIWCARKFIGGEPFAVLLGDTFVESEVPSLKQMMAAFERYKAPIVGVQPVDPRFASSYGIVDARPLHNGIYSIKRLIEKPKPEESISNLAMIGRYLLTPSIFDVLERAEAGFGNEIQLTDALSELNRREPVYACEIEGAWHDVGDHWGYVKSILAAALKRPDLRKDVYGYLRTVSDDRSREEDDDGC